VKAWGKELRLLVNGWERPSTFDAEDAEEDHIMSKIKDVRLVAMERQKG